MHKYVSNCAICLKISLCSQEELSHRNAQIRVWQGLPGLILSLTKVAQHSILGSQLPSRPICLICLLHGCLLYPLNLGFQFGHIWLRLLAQDALATPLSDIAGMHRLVSQHI